MADQSHCDILQQGVEAWNSWRERNPSIKPDLTWADLSGVDLSGANLSEANFSGANLSEANFSGANLSEANLKGANLSKAILKEADLGDADLFSAILKGAILWEAKLSGFYGTGELSEADLSEAVLVGADLSGVDLSGANLSEANLEGANLSQASLKGANLSEAILKEANLFNADLSWANLTRANLTRVDFSEADLSEADLSGGDISRSILVRANFQGSTLTSCRIYGISAWDLQGTPRDQSNLIISPGDRNAFATVDDLEVAQFVYLLFENRKLRNIIQTMTSKAVLILGNFAPERMEVLQAIRGRLRDNDYLPILFDFEGPENRNLIDTVTTVARLVRFVIADLTQPRSVPAELGAIVKAIESLPVQPLIEEPEEPYGMFSDLVERHSVLKVHHYKDLGHLLESLDDAIIAPAEDKFEELKEARIRAIKEKL